MDLNAPERINDKALELLQKRFDKVEPKFVKSISDWIQKFETSSGNLTRSKDNKARLATFKRAVNRYLLESGYNNMISQFLTAFDDVATHEQDIHQELNGIKLNKSFLNTYKNWAVNNVIASVQGNGLSTAIINPLKQEMFIAVNQGSSLKDVVLSITGQLTTTNVRQGILKRQVLQGSRDALLQYDGIVNEAVRKVYKMPALMYVGSIVKDSRPQCERWVNEMKNGELGVLLFEDLEDEIDWAESNGSGMIPNTTPENFCQNRGGFNCRHIAYPIRLAKKKADEEEVVVPKEEEKPVPKEEEKVFVEAKSIEEAKERMLNIGVKKADIDNFSKEHYNMMLKALENTPKKAIPSIITDKNGYELLTGIKIKRKDDEWMGLALTTEVFNKKEMKFSSEKILVINVKGFKNLDLMSNKKNDYNSKYSKLKNGSKWYFNTFNGSTHYHELGHIFDNGKVSNKAEWIDIANKWHNESNVDLLKVSKGGDFSGINGSEAFAEAFASYFGNNKNNLPKYVIDFFDKNIK